MVYIGIDPGAGGALSVKDGSNIVVFDTPLLKKKDSKKDYDIIAMSDILLPYRGKNVVVYLELVHAFRGQGVSSSFNFGRGRGLWEGLVIAHGFRLVLTSPQTWKKYFPPLAPPPRQKKSDVPTKDSTSIVLKTKSELASDKRLFKAAAKAKAREIASKMFPQLADRFKTVNSDGRAEAVLLAVFAEATFKE